MPTHLHSLQTTNQDIQANRTADTENNFIGPANNLYGQPSNLTTLDPSAVTSVGGSQPHNNMMPYLVLNFIIALQGIFPSQN
jgi:microcystin-dependent protein